MSWGLIITTGIMAALVYGYWSHRRDSRELRVMFAGLAARYQGEITDRHWLALPQLRFTLDNRRVLVAALATSGGVVAGTSGYSGPFTFVELALPDHPGRTARIVRRAGVFDALWRAVSAPARTTAGPGIGLGDATSNTMVDEFDQAFQITGPDRDFAAAHLSETMRVRLLRSTLARLDVRLAGAKLSVRMDGLASAVVEIEELLDIANSIADLFAASSRPNNDG